MEDTDLFADAGEDDEEGGEEGDEDDAQRDGRHVSGDGRPVGVVVQRRSAIVTERVEPAPHGAELSVSFGRWPRALLLLLLLLLLLHGGLVVSRRVCGLLCGLLCGRSAQSAGSPSTTWKRRTETDWSAHR